ncbi:hypothetical protein [Streptomyces sp. NPDC006863]
MADLAALIWPLGRYPDLVWGANMFGWFCLFEDQFDGPQCTDVDQTARVINEYVDLLSGEPDRPGAWENSASVQVRAFGQFWIQTRTGMSADWIRRITTSFTAFFTMYVTEAQHARDAVRLSFERYLAYRIISTGGAMTFDLIERYGEFELSAAARALPDFADMYKAALHGSALHNDLVSLEREHAVGDGHNGVLVRAAEAGYGIEDAANEVLAMCNAYYREVFHRADQLPRSRPFRDLTRADQDALLRFIQGLRHRLRGELDWYSHTRRYTRPHAFTATGGAHPANTPPITGAQEP